MNLEPTAPLCMIKGCDRLSALSDIAMGNVLSLRADFCADCYQRIVDGEHLELDPSRLEVAFAPSTLAAALRSDDVESVGASSLE